MKYLIDTNICIYLMNQRPGELIQKFKQYTPGEIGVSSITVSELQYGVAKSTRGPQNQQRLDTFLAPLEVLAYDERAANMYGKTRAQLENRGETIGPLDQLIAAHALAYGLILVTNYDKEFKRIKKLKVENWVRIL